jgi:alpha-glucosidase
MDVESTYNLPFVPQLEKEGNFDTKTLSLNATHPGYGDETEYNLHNLYGHMEAWRTHEFLTSDISAPYPYDNRAFTLSRSTFASSGRFTSHWLGDNH